MLSVISPWHTDHATSVSSPSPSSGTSSIGSIDSPLSSSITPSLFHSRLKTFLFCKSFPLQPFLFFFRTDSTDSPDCLPRYFRAYPFLLFSCSFDYILVVGSVWYIRVSYRSKRSHLCNVCMQCRLTISHLHQCNGWSQHHGWSGNARVRAGVLAGRSSRRWARCVDHNPVLTTTDWLTLMIVKRYPGQQRGQELHINTRPLHFTVLHCRDM